MTKRHSSLVAKQAIRAHLEEMEDRCIAIERLEHPAERIPLEDLERELDLEG